MDKDLSEVLYIKALAARLGTDQGVIIHHNDTGYIVYKNIKNKTLGIQEDERFLCYPDGQLVSTGVSKLDDTAEIAEAEENDEEATEIFTRVKDGPSFKLDK